MATEDERRFEAFKSRFDLSRVSGVAASSLNLIVMDCPQPSCLRKLAFVVRPNGQIVEVDVLAEGGVGYWGVVSDESILSKRIRDYLKTRGIMCCAECKTTFRPIIKRTSTGSGRVKRVLNPPPLPKKKRRDE